MPELPCRASGVGQDGARTFFLGPSPSVAPPKGWRCRDLFAGDSRRTGPIPRRPTAPRVCAGLDVDAPRRALYERKDAVGERRTEPGRQREPALVVHRVGVLAKKKKKLPRFHPRCPTLPHSVPTTQPQREGRTDSSPQAARVTESHKGWLAGGAARREQSVEPSSSKRAAGGGAQAKLPHEKSSTLEPRHIVCAPAPRRTARGLLHRLQDGDHVRGDVVVRPAGRRRARLRRDSLSRISGRVSVATHGSSARRNHAESENRMGRP